MNSEIGVMKIMKEMCFRALRLAEFSIHNKNILWSLETILDLQKLAEHRWMQSTLFQAYEARVVFLLF